MLNRASSSRISLTPNEDRGFSGPVNVSSGPTWGSLSGPVPVPYGVHNTPGFSGPVQVCIENGGRPLYSVRAADATLMRFDGDVWGPLVQLDAEAARSWELGYTVNYSIAPHMGALLIIWSDGRFQETVAARYDDTGLTILSRIKGAAGNNVAGQLVLGEPFNSGGRILCVASCSERYIVDVRCGSRFTLMKRNDNTVFAWGQNNHGQAQPPRDLEDVDLIATGYNHGVVQRMDGTLVAWGLYTTVRAHLNPWSTPITDIPAGIENVAELVGGGYFTAIRRPNGTVFVWGDMHLVFFDGSTQRNKMLGMTNVIEISAGLAHCVVRYSDNTVDAFGYNNLGQTNVPSGLKAISVAAGNRFNIAAKEDGTVVGWGNSSWGVLDIPPGLDNVVKVYAGGFQAFALRSNGEIVGWGQTDWQQQAVPPGNLRNPRVFDSGFLHSAYVLQDQSLWAWGANGAGQSNYPDHRNHLFYISVDQDWDVSVVREQIIDANEVARSTAKDQPGSAAAMAAHIVPHAHQAVSFPSGYGQRPVFTIDDLTSLHLRNPDLLATTVEEWGNWWLDHGFDPATGRWWARLDREGNPLDQREASLGQSRNAYALSKAFMITGDTKFLVAAKKGLEYLDTKFWDPVHGGWFHFTYQSGPNVGQIIPQTSRSAFHEHYCQLGFIAYYEATRDPAILALKQRSIDFMNANFWDDRPGLEGYFNSWDTTTGDNTGKGFTPTVDGIATNHLYGALVLGFPEELERFQDLAENILDHIIPSMDDPSVVFGFVSNYDADWIAPDPPIGGTGVNVGHMLKTVWVLARAGMYFRDVRYIEGALRIADEVLSYDPMGPNAAWDYEYGGPYSNINYLTGIRVNSNKDWWMVEQGFTGLITLWHVTGDMRFLRLADASLHFFFSHFEDPEFGEVYHTVGESGLPVSDPNKATDWKAGYHSLETAFLGYLYAKLYMYGQPVSLYYQFEPQAGDRTLQMNVVEILSEAGLYIIDVELDGVAYTDFTAADRMLTIPDGVGGIFKITYGTFPRFGFGRYEDTRNIVSAPTQAPVSTTAPATGSAHDFGGVTFREWARMSDRYDPWPRMVIASLSYQGTLLHFSLDGVVYWEDPDFRTLRPVVDLVDVVDLSPTTLLTQQENPHEGETYDGGSLWFDLTALEGALGNWRGDARVEVHTSSHAFYPVGKRGRITWDRGGGRLEAVAMNWEDSFSRDTTGPLGYPIGFDGHRHPSVPIPEGTVLEVRPGLFGPLDSRDLACRVPVRGYAFEAEGLAWFVYVSGESDGSGPRHPPFLAAFSLDDDRQLDGGLYAPLEVLGRPINASGASFHYDPKSRVLDILYHDPEAATEYLLRVAITATSATPFHYAALTDLDPNDPRPQATQGNLSTFSLGDRTALITQAGFNAQTMEGTGTVVITGPAGGIDLIVEYATDDNPEFRPVTLIGRPVWVASPAGQENTFRQDLEADGINPFLTKAQYRVSLVENVYVPGIQSPLVDLYVEGVVHGCDLGPTAITVNGIPVALVFGADNATYLNGVQYRRTDGAMKVASLRMVDVSNYQLEVCHNSPELSGGGDGAVMWVVPTGAPPSALLCSAEAEPGQIVTFGSCSLTGSDSTVVVGASACFPGPCVPAPTDVCEYYLEVAEQRDYVLPKTGQTSVIRTGDDGYHQKGETWPSPRLVDNGDGTVTDNLTGLMWIRNVNHLGIKMNWASALAACESETFAGHSDWRMPNMRELVSLGRSYGFYQPSIPAEFFGASSTNRRVWTSTTLAYDTATAVQQEIWSGQYQQPSAKTATQCVMLVRSVVAEPNVLKTGQITSYAAGDDGAYQIGKTIPSPRFVDNGNGTVTDMLTNLVWLKDSSSIGSSQWSTAIDRCNALADGQHGLSDGSVAGDWRLPNLFELHSLIDMSNSNSATTLALPTGHPFTVIPLVHYGYYSSTYMTGWIGGNLRQGVHMSRGYASYAENVEGTSPSWQYAWAVRDPKLTASEVYCVPEAPEADTGWAWDPALYPTHGGWTRSVITAAGCPCIAYSEVENNWVECGMPADPQPYPKDPPAAAADCTDLDGPHWTSTVTLTGCGGPGDCAAICTGDISYSTTGGSNLPPPDSCWALWNIDSVPFGDWSGYLYLIFTGTQWDVQLGIYGGPEWWGYDVAVTVSGDGRFLVSGATLIEVTSFGCNNITLDIT